MLPQGAFFTGFLIHQRCADVDIGNFSQFLPMFLLMDFCEEYKPFKKAKNATAWVHKYCYFITKTAKVCYWKDCLLRKDCGVYKMSKAKFNIKNV